VSDVKNRAVLGRDNKREIGKTASKERKARERGRDVKRRRRLETLKSGSLSWMTN